MREFVSISFAQFSHAFWERVELKAEYGLRDRIGKTFLRIGAGPYCIGDEVGYWLFCLARFYAPKTVCEIGTYRGRSATALAMGMGSGTIWTCDKDMDVPVPRDFLDDGMAIHQHHMTSTEMLKNLKEPIDLFFFDGRIQVDDMPHIARLSHPHTVYVLDDFEGLEKGVHNALKLVDETKILITENARLAAVIPWNTIKVTHQ